MIIKQCDAAYIRQLPTGEYEIVMNRKFTAKSRAGQPIPLTDEDFGYWAWTAYTLEKAERIYQEIVNGTRGMRSYLDTESEA